MAGKCKHRWLVPLLLPPSEGGGKEFIETKCSLEKGHDGDHRSWSNVTAPNTEEKK